MADSTVQAFREYMQDRYGCSTTLTSPDHIFVTASPLVAVAQASVKKSARRWWQRHGEPIKVWPAPDGGFIVQRTTDKGSTT